MTLLLFTVFIEGAHKLRATHVMARLESERLQIWYLIDGKRVESEHPPARLWKALLKYLTELAALDELSSALVQTGMVQFATSEGCLDLVIHAKSNAFLIEMPAAKAAEHLVSIEEL